MRLRSLVRFTIALHAFVLAACMTELAVFPITKTIETREVENSRILQTSEPTKVPEIPVYTEHKEKPVEKLIIQGNGDIIDTKNEISEPETVPEDDDQSQSSDNQNNQNEELTFVERNFSEDLGDCINFDVIPYLYAEPTWTVNDCQYYLDQGYTTFYQGDVWHHNTANFMSLFNQLAPGVKLRLCGINYVCTGVEHGYTDSWNVYTDSGINVFTDGATQLITCSGSAYDSGRWIVFLQ